MFSYQKEVEQELAEVKKSFDEAYKKKDLRYQSEKHHLDEIEDEILQILASQGGSNNFHGQSFEVFFHIHKEFLSCDVL